MVLLEICVFNITDAHTAIDNGANRIELCASYLEGGITPSHAVIEAVLKMVDPAMVVVMVRPRGGNFIYDAFEFEIMKKDILHCKSIGVQNIIFGIIQNDGRLDKEKNKSLVDLASPMHCTLQRAFDLTTNPMEALEDAITCGFQRILTSGQQPTVLQGKELIKKLLSAAAGRIDILPGAGITSLNAAELIQYTGCKEIHTSAKKYTKTAIGFRSGIYDFSQQTETDGIEVQALYNITKNI